MMKKKMLIIGPVPPPYNGMSVITEMVLKSSINRNFDIIHLDITDRRSLKNVGKFDLINIWLAIKHFFQFIRLNIIKRPDFVYLPIAQNIPGYLRDALFLIPCQILNTKVIIHLHGSYFREFYEKTNNFIKALINFTLKKVSGAIVLGNGLKYIFKKWLSDEKIFVVPNGVEDNFKDIPKVCKKNDAFRILFLSNLCREKGLFEILKVIPQIVNLYNNVKFVFAGEWMREDERREAMEFIKSHKIQSYVDFIGVVSGERKKEILIKSHLFLLLPTYYPFEGQPLVILEAMSAGLPVISSDKGAINDAVVNGENGFLIEPEDVKELVEKILKLISDPELCRIMGQKSREIYLRKFTKEKFLTNLFNVFNKVLYS